MNLDHILLVAALSAYIIGSIVLIAYVLSASTLLRNVGMGLAVIGCVAQFAELGVRWAVSGIWPLTNLYGSLSLFAAMGVVVYLAFVWRYKVWYLGGFVLLIAAIALGYATTWNEGYMPAVPSLQSYWIKVHVPLVISSYAAFMVAFVVAIMYLMRYWFEQYLGRSQTVVAAAANAGPVNVPARLFGGEAAVGDVGIVGLRDDTPRTAAAAARGDVWALWFQTLPSLAKLDIMAYRIVAVGLPLLTIGIITGAWWAKEAWGAYWQWDPKETAALVSWIVYASYMHLHTRNQWRGFRCALVNVFGFATIVFCYLGVNIWISGMHSYKM
jgi:cytochrome c-type biogenesis protein CcsB